MTLRWCDEAVKVCSLISVSHGAGSVASLGISLHADLEEDYLVKVERSALREVKPSVSSETETVTTDFQGAAVDPGS